MMPSSSITASDPHVSAKGASAVAGVTDNIMQDVTIPVSHHVVIPQPHKSVSVDIG